MTEVELTTSSEEVSSEEVSNEGTSNEEASSEEASSEAEEESSSDETVVSGDITATAKIASDWGSGVTVEIVLNNNTGTTFTNGWTVQLTTNRKITQLWNNGLESLGNNVYQISNPILFRQAIWLFF